MGANEARSNALVPRFTVRKFKAFLQYRESSSSLRVGAVLVLTPLVSLVTCLIPPLIPLRDPHDGLEANFPTYVCHVVVSTGLTAFGAAFNFRAGASISHQDYPTLRLIVASVFTTLWLVGVGLLGSFVWRFPVPFLWVVVYSPGFTGFLLFHYLAMRHRLAESEQLKRQIASYVPVFAVQVAQVAVYSSFSAAYQASSEPGRIVLTILFPLMKFTLKRTLRRFSDPNSEVTEEVANSGVGIAAIIYQSMIMQSTPPVAVAVLLIGVDVLQGLLEVKRMMEIYSAVPQTQVLSTAALHVNAWQGDDSAYDSHLRSYGSKRPAPFGSIRTSAIAPEQRPTSALTQRDKVVVPALEIIQAAETILLVEYLEVVIPILNGIFLAFASQFHSAVYNKNIYEFYFHRDRIKPALLSLQLYVGLQLMSLGIVAAIMKSHFRLNPSALLAFTLERQAWSIQSKMVSWLACLLQFSIMHYGADFTFKFDFKIPTPDD